MSIRSTAKAIIVNDGKILLNKCHDKMNGDYYALPGGGQHKYETLHEAVIRECSEETGYTVTPIKLAALCEEICMDEEFREKDPDYAHKMYHVFMCEITNEIAEIPTEKDSMQVDCQWVEIDFLENIKLFPKAVGNSIIEILSNTAPIFLGSELIRFNHG